MQKIWKPIKNYEGLYEVSNCGEVRNKNKKLLKPRIDKDGYVRVMLSKNSKLKLCQVHRLVANTFLGESELTVNHKDENKQNNNLDNLEFMTNKENNRYSKCKKVSQYDIEGKFIKTYQSLDEAESKYNNNHISECCKGKRKTASGYIWRYGNAS